MALDGVRWPIDAVTYGCYMTYGIRVFAPTPEIVGKTTRAVKILRIGWLQPPNPSIIVVGN